MLSPPGLLKRFFVSFKMNKLLAVLRIFDHQAKAVIAYPLATEEPFNNIVLESILGT